MPQMEGKSLCMAFCGEAGGDDGADAGPVTNLVTLDFGGIKKTSPPQPTAPPAASADGPLFAPLGEFITGDRGVEWHEPSKGLAVVRGILTKLGAGATVALDPSFDFFDGDEDELTEGVTFDLQELEGILTAAESARTRFRLMIDV